MIKAVLNKKLAGLLTRHVMGAIGAVAIANGYADADTWQTITGGAVALSAVALSGAEKAFR